MSGKKPDYKVLVSREGQDREGNDKNFYTEIGSAWAVAKGGISVQLNALPVNGKMVIFPREEKTE